MVYLPTFTINNIKKQLNLSKYTSPMDAMGTFFKHMLSHLAEVYPRILARPDTYPFSGVDGGDDLQVCNVFTIMYAYKYV